ncbi:hypothetical protein QMG83_05900 [Salinibacterium sp. G-O1]|uniref:DUF6804 family protein n=1 Tax=Salinibacterium sp. G-O1 TaxID=3046208 RepID=UPI0024BB9D6F|nr:DUF6804 family protein [Salinibacterium sp. G-O1]MDJ0334753.1 hypothetical protein [Salinibacterium sp. G-O1]
MSAHYPSDARRTALVPALLGTIALLIGSALITSDSFTVIRFIVSIFALIVAVFAWQAAQWWWIIGLAPIAVLWNPVLPIDLGAPELWLGLQFVAAAIFIAAGIRIKVSGKTA